jgi:hypothetical protein
MIGESSSAWKTSSGRSWNDKNQHENEEECADEEKCNCMQDEYGKCHCFMRQLNGQPMDICPENNCKETSTDEDSDSDYDSEIINSTDPKKS